MRQFPRLPSKWLTQIFHFRNAIEIFCLFYHLHKEILSNQHGIRTSASSLCVTSPTVWIITFLLLRSWVRTISIYTFYSILQLIFVRLSIIHHRTESLDDNYKRFQDSAWCLPIYIFLISDHPSSLTNITFFVYYH